MNRNNNDVHAVELLVLGVMLLAEALVLIAVPLIALVLTLAGWQPRRSPRNAPPVPLQQAPADQPMPSVARPWLPPSWPDLEALTVTELRRLARAAGLPRSLTRSGRRAELLPALAGAAMAW